MADDEVADGILMSMRGRGQRAGGQQREQRNEA